MLMRVRGRAGVASRSWLAAVPLHVAPFASSIGSDVPIEQPLSGRHSWSSKERRRSFVEQLKAKFGVEKTADWRAVGTSDVRQLPGGRGFLSWHGDSLYTGLREFYPRIVEEGGVQRMPRGHWETWETRREAMEAVGKSCGITDFSDGQQWRKVALKDVEAVPGGAQLLKRHNGSVYRLLVDTFPEEQWPEFLCRKKVSDGYWEVASHRAAFLLHLAEQDGLPLQSLVGGTSVSSEDMARAGAAWADVTGVRIAALGGRGLLALYDGSVEAVLQATFPALSEIQLPGGGGRGPRHPRGYWSSHANRRAFMDDVAGKLGVVEPSGWRSVTTEEVDKLGGTGLLKRYGRSMLRLLQDVYPEAELSARDCRERVPVGHWARKERRVELLDSIAEKHGVSSMADWVKVTAHDVTAAGGAALLKRYSSVMALLVDSYGPKYGGQAWDVVQCRPNVPSDHWADNNRVTEFIRMVQRKLVIEDREDWYRVSVRQLKDMGGAGLLARMTLVDALRIAYPKETWRDLRPGPAPKRAVQRHMLTTVNQLFH